MDLDRNVVGLEGNNNVLLRIVEGSELDLDNNSWVINGENAGTFALEDDSYSIEFTGVNQFEGGSGDDRFLFSVRRNDANVVVSSGSLVEGAINGGAGSNTITIDTAIGELAFAVGSISDVAAEPEQIYPGSSSTEVYLLNNRALGDGLIETANITSLTSTSADAEVTLVGADIDAGTATWNIGLSGANTYADSDGNSIAFAGIEYVAGGAADDTFNIYDLDQVINSYNGGEGTGDLVNLTPQTTSLNISLDLTEDAHVYLENVEQVQTNENNNTLIGHNTDSVWEINGENDGQVMYGPADDRQTLTFTNMANLQGGDATDTFRFSAQTSLPVPVYGMITGVINGGSQADGEEDSIEVLGSSTLDFTFQMSAADTGATVVDISGIENVSANELQNNTLVGYSDAANIWLVSALGNNVNNMGFSGFNRLIGGDNVDSFTFDGRVVSGLVDAGLNTTGTDTAAFSNVDDLAIHIGNRETADVNLVGFEQITSSVNGASIQADDVTNEWQINPSGFSRLRQTAGTDSSDINFSGFEQLIGGSDNDEFIFTTGVDLANYQSIDGGADTAARDVLDLEALTSTFVVSMDADYVGADLYAANLEDIRADNTNNSDLARNELVADGTTGTTNTWTINGENAGDINGITFSGFADL